MLLNEKRRSHRVPIEKGYAHCLGNGSVGVYKIADLSTGGTLLKGGESMTVGTQIEVFLFLPHHDAISTQGIVRRQLRSHGSRTRLAVEFERVSALDESELADAVADEMRRSFAPVVLVCDASEWDGDSLLAHLQGQGFGVMHATSALETITRLEDRSLPIHAVIIGMDLGFVLPEDFVRLLSERFPGVRRVLVAGAREDLSTNAHRTADAILPKGWTPNQLKAAVSATGPAVPPPFPDH